MNQYTLTKVPSQCVVTDSKRMVRGPARWLECPPIYLEIVRKERNDLVMILLGLVIVM